MHSSVHDMKVALAAVCQRYNVASLAVFGSASRGADFFPDRSDADLLVEFGPWDGHDPFLAFKEDLERILGRPVDLVDRKALEASRNYIKKTSILADADLVYGS